MRNTLITAIILIITTLGVDAQRPVMDTQTRAFNTSFKNIRIYPTTSELAPPIINLNSNDELVITFDELADDNRYLRYSLIHCDANWQPSQLIESEYTDGLNFSDITDYAYSDGTLANYVNYRFSIPNDDINILKSGNYLIQIYPDDDPEDILLQTRFYVNEPLVNISAAVSASTDIDYRAKSQQLSFKVNTANCRIFDARRDTKVYVTQNRRIDNEVMADAPMRIQGDDLYYEHNAALIFPAGNEYRRFENTSTTYAGMNVDQIKYYDPYYHATLFMDQPRGDAPYLFDKTQHGAYVNNALNVYDIDTNSDYNVVHFSLQSPEIQGGKLYLNGDLTNNLFNSDSQMIYNSRTGCYELSLLLKQGSYNYQYLWLPDGNSVGYTQTFEGDKYQTINQYIIRFYHRPQGARYDRLIGYTVVYSE